MAGGAKRILLKKRTAAAPASSTNSENSPSTDSPIIKGQVISWKEAGISKFYATECGEFKVEYYPDVCVLNPFLAGSDNTPVDGLKKVISENLVNASSLRSLVRLEAPGTGNTLFKYLLNVNTNSMELQTFLLSHCFEQIISIGQKKVPAVNNDDDVKRQVNLMTSVLLNHIKGLDWIQDSRTVLERCLILLSDIEFLNVSERILILEALPVLVTMPQEVKLVADCLLKILMQSVDSGSLLDVEEEGALILAVLEALANIDGLDEEYLTRIRTAIFHQISEQAKRFRKGSPLNLIPGLVKFIFQSIPLNSLSAKTTDGSEGSSSVLSAILKQLEDSLFLEDLIRCCRDAGSSLMVLLVEAIHSGMRFDGKYRIRDAMIKEFSDRVESCPDFRVFELVCTLVLLQASSMQGKRKLEAIFVKRLEAFLEDGKKMSIFQRSVRELLLAPGCFDLFFEVLLNLAEFSIRQDNASVAGTASGKRGNTILYEELFRVAVTLGEDEGCFFQMREIVTGVIGHLGSGRKEEVDTALCLLWKFWSTFPEESHLGASSTSRGASRNKVPALVQFVPILKGILDVIDCLALDQIGQLFELFTILSVQGRQGGGSNLLQELLVLVRKYVSVMGASNEVYKRIGITAGLSVVKRLANYDQTGEEEGQGSSKSPSSMDYHEQAQEVMEMIYNACKHSMTSLSLFYDEISNRLLYSYNNASDVVDVKSLAFIPPLKNVKLLKWINEKLASATFSRVFLMDLGEEYDGYLQAYKRQSKGCKSPLAPLKIIFNLDDLVTTNTCSLESNEGGGGGLCELAVAIVPNLISGTMGTCIDSTLKIHGLCSLFRLVYLSERALAVLSLDTSSSSQVVDVNEDLTVAIGALLGCPIIGYPIDFNREIEEESNNGTSVVMEKKEEEIIFDPWIQLKSEQERDLYAHYLFYACNWFIEVVNAFSVILLAPSNSQNSINTTLSNSQQQATYIERESPLLSAREKVIERMCLVASLFKRLYQFHEQKIPSFRPLRHPQNVLYLSTGKTAVSDESDIDTNSLLDEPSLIYYGGKMMRKGTDGSSDNENDADKENDKENDNESNHSTNNSSKTSAAETTKKRKGKQVVSNHLSNKSVTSNSSMVKRRKGSNNMISSTSSSLVNRSNLKAMPMNELRKYLRPLDPIVFNLMIPHLDGKWEALSFLLEDYCQSLSSSANCSDIDEGKTLDFIALELIPSLVEQLTSEPSDNSVSGNNENREEECQVVVNCLELLLRCHLQQLNTFLKGSKSTMISSEFTRDYLGLVFTTPRLVSCQYGMTLYRIIEKFTAASQTGNSIKDDFQIPVIEVLKQKRFISTCAIEEDGNAIATFILEEELKLAAASSPHLLLQKITRNVEFMIAADEENKEEGKEEEGKDEESKEKESCPWYSRQTMAIYHRLNMSHLATCLERSMLTDSDGNEDSDDILSIVKVHLSHFLALNSFVRKCQDPSSKSTSSFTPLAKSLISNCLRYGRDFLEVFMKRVMPYLDSQFGGEQRPLVTELLQLLQKSTRLLQNMCGTSKGALDASLINRIPALRKSLESLVFRVKSMLDRNGCVNAFWIGNLKHRNLSGAEIKSTNLIEFQEKEEPEEEDDEGDEGNEGEGEKKALEDQASAADNNDGNENEENEEENDEDIPLNEGPSIYMEETGDQD